MEVNTKTPHFDSKFGQLPICPEDGQRFLQSTGSPESALEDRESLRSVELPSALAGSPSTAKRTTTNTPRLNNSIPSKTNNPPAHQETGRDGDGKPFDRETSFIGLGGITPGGRKTPCEKQDKYLPGKCLNKSPTFILEKVDFVPTNGDTLSVLLKKASAYLSKHPDEYPLSCETLLMDETVEYNTFRRSMTRRIVRRFIDGETAEVSHVFGGVHHCRILRLWVVPRDKSRIREETPRAQDVVMPDGSLSNKVHHELYKPPSLACRTMVPKCKNEGKGVTGTLSFDSMWETLFNFNKSLRSNPIPGKILSIQTDLVSFRRWDGKVDTESVFWDPDDVSLNQLGTYYLSILRIYYIPGSTSQELIGYQDFTPQNYAGNLSDPVFDSLTHLTQDAQKWMSIHRNKNFTNMQTIEYKVEKDRYGDFKFDIDGDEVLYHENFSDNEEKSVWGRILRVYYSGPIPETVYRLPHLTVKTFHSGCGDQILNMHRVGAYLNHTAPKLVGVETARLPALPPDCSTHGLLDSMMIGCSLERRLSVRLFLDGEYMDPPLGVVPPILLDTSRHQLAGRNLQSKNSPTESVACIIL